MNKSEYQAARRLIRDNGNYALRWLSNPIASTMDMLIYGQRADRLAIRADIVAYCKRVGLECNVRHTA